MLVVQARKFLIGKQVEKTNNKSINRPFIYYIFQHLTCHDHKLFTPGERSSNLHKMKQFLASEKRRNGRSSCEAIGSAGGPDKTRLTENPPNGKLRNSDRSIAFNYSKFSKHLFASLWLFICCFSALFGNNFIFFHVGSSKLDNFYCCLMISILNSIFAEWRI